MQSLLNRRTKPLTVANSLLHHGYECIYDKAANDVKIPELVFEIVNVP